MNLATSEYLAAYRRLQDRVKDPLLTLLTVALLLLVFVFAPLHAADIFHSQDIGIAIALGLVVIVLLMSGSLFAVVVMLVAIGLSTAAAMGPDGAAGRMGLYLNVAAWILLGFSLLWVVARTVFAPGQITYHRIIGAILLYLMIGLVFVGLFAAIALAEPTAFSGIAMSNKPGLGSELVYFSFVTLTSTGYGDIVPVNPIARSLCNVEAIIGQLYPATLLARLVTLELANRQSRVGHDKNS